MSCIHCTGKYREGTEPVFPCPCDRFIHPEPLQINAGLSRIPRQLATFPEFRRAMLKALKNEEVELIDRNNQLVRLKPLSNWQARDKDDLGIMLLEMWAYVCDSLSFYDEVLAHEAYLRTCRLRPGLRRLVALLGYLPRPAVGSVVSLAAIADGRLELRLPAGTAFRSGAFEGNPPQVFELEKDAFINPFHNRWQIQSPRPINITSKYPIELLVLPHSEIKEGALLLLINNKIPAQNQGLVVEKVERHTGADRQNYTKLIFTTRTLLTKDAELAYLNLMKPMQSAPLWTLNRPSASVSSNILVLDKLYAQIKPLDFILVVRGGKNKCFKVLQVSSVPRNAVADSNMEINGTSFHLPGITVIVTMLTLDKPVIPTPLSRTTGIDSEFQEAAEITVFFELQLAAKVIDEPKSTLYPADAPWTLNGNVEVPVGSKSPTNFLLKDKNTIGAIVDGKVHYHLRILSLNRGTILDPELTTPVEAFGNVIWASRGEKVENEKLGSGNASIPNQAFKLKKKPLTFHLSPTAENNDAVKNTLIISVNGIQWTEVKSFFGKTENDQVYIVRQDDEGETLVIFGNGIRGERVPTGMDNIIASYRFGAEAACPPAGSVNQISKPVKGLQSVKNMLPASGGANAESSENLRTHAPKSALILGRAVSLQDMEALGGQFPGVRAVQAEWRWNGIKQTASAHIFIIGTVASVNSLEQRLRSVSDPSISITVTQAKPIATTVFLDILFNPRHSEAAVIKEIRTALLDKEKGLLAPEKIGIGKPLYRSKLFEAILKVKGTVSVQHILFNQSNFSDFAIRPEAGHYFDVGQGGLIINRIEN